MRKPAVLTLAALTLLGCKSADELKQACLSGSISSCSSACDKGISGEGGCLSAAQEHLHDDRATATSFFVKACEAGEPVGCMEAANSVALVGTEPSPIREQWQDRAIELFTKRCHDGDSTACDRAISLLNATSDAKGRREALLVRSCELGEASSCAWLIRAAFGRPDDGKATRAARRYCALKRQGQAAVSACERALSNKLEALREAGSACRAGRAPACEVLGDALANLDPPRAASAYERSCMLRKLDSDALWSGWSFDLKDTNGTPVRRVSADDGGLACCTAALYETRLVRGVFDDLVDIDPDSWNPRSAGSGGRSPEGKSPVPEVERGTVAIASGTRSGQSVSDALDTLRSAWIGCYQQGLESNPSLQGSVRLHMLMDPNGKVLPLGDKGSDLPDTVVRRCMARALLALETGGGSPCRVTVDVVLRPRP